MLQNYEVDIQDFIKITNAGIQTATFTQIRDALIRNYKGVYGSDIDLSTSNADGVYINNLALIINNILESFKTIYSNLDVNTASGIYLDNLCALSNITRKPATYSTAVVNVKNNSNTELNLENLIFVDKAGTEWKNYESFTLGVKDSDNDNKNLIVTCSEIGAVEAPPGWIDKTLEILDIIITQEEEANIGEEIESDSDLRNRRAQSTGADGVTVLESLISALLEISGIQDVKIYNNNSGSNIQYPSNLNAPKDKTNIPSHGIYVIVRKNTQEDLNSQIGEIIYQKLTPGISSTQSTDILTGTPKFYDYIPVGPGGSSLTLFNKKSYWKEAIGVSPEIKITIIPYENFTQDEVDVIGNNIINYLNNLPLSTNLTINKLISEAIQADPYFSGRATYGVNSVSIDDTNSDYLNTDTFYNYQNISYNAIDNIIILS